MTNQEASQDRKNEAYRLRVAGKTYRDIGRLMGIGHGTAERWCKEVMEATALPLIDEVRKMEVDRLTRYLDVLDARIDDGDDKAVNLAIKVSESLRKLLGVDVPTVSITETHVVDQVDLDIRALIDAQNARNATNKDAAARKELPNG